MVTAKQAHAVRPEAPADLGVGAFRLGQLRLMRAKFIRL